MLAFFLNLPIWAQIFIAVATVGIFNGIVKLFKDWAKAIGAPAKPLSITFKTDKTPQEIMDAARAAKLKRQMTVVSMIGVVWLAAIHFRPEVFLPVTRDLFSLVVDIISILGRTLVSIAGQLGELLQESSGIS